MDFFSSMLSDLSKNFYKMTENINTPDQFMMHCSLYSSVLNIYGDNITKSHKEINHKLMEIIEKDDNLLFEQIIYDNNINVNINSNIIFRYAVYYKAKKIIEYLVNNGVKINTYYNFALKFASGNDISYLQFIINLGADIFVDTYFVLINAICEGKLDNIKLLLDLGLDVNINNCSPLIYSIARNKYDIFEYLINIGADFKSCENEIWKEYCNGDLNIKYVQLLLEKGINVSKITNQQIIQIICKKDSIKILELLIKYGLNLSRLNNYKQDDNCNKLVHILLNGGLSQDVINNILYSV
ncbi:ankyrin repeat protein [Acanthamoeba polyphaga moumouvirus]|uniref:Ankyrin repeat protein n=2 Tax=Moumouvirus TaxID=3080801 RepID=L7RB76_9VIRU|nr:ankyrin repeat protein [Acanthamoeba polyphaga moumouvirus]AEX63150.1 putative ankyrin repeat protein [Moumouvirus Monve]AGC01689.1 ankyrin repeat protein [Acanthamoeba polyphaga moumouvirus]AQN68027.1 ankyrin repeat protein [Saudi moumouvirus]